jgi:hypothetical protein
MTYSKFIIEWTILMKEEKGRIVWHCVLNISIIKCAYSATNIARVFVLEKNLNLMDKNPDMVSFRFVWLHFQKL